LAENVLPADAEVLVAAVVVVALDGIVVVALVALVGVVVVALDGIVVVALVALVVVVPDAFELFVLVALVCANAGPRLNAVAKSPKTSTSATAKDAFFIAKTVQN
jgi:hypothetical protein